MLKLPMRPRQIDWNKPLLVLRENYDCQLSDQEFSSLHKAMSGHHLATGMEKEEESEHHIQQVLQKHITSGDARIPVPELLDRSAEYRETYQACLADFRLPPTLIQASQSNLGSVNEFECLGDNFGQFSSVNLLSNLDYDADTDDEQFLKEAVEYSPLDRETFELLMDCFEKGCGKKVPSLKEGLSLARKFTAISDLSGAVAVYDYWLEKRLQRPSGFIHTIKQEHQQEGSASDSYIAFRRRSEKMQTRRLRKTDELSYERMFRFHQSLLLLKQVVYDVYRREMTKKYLSVNKSQIDELQLAYPNQLLNSKLIANIRNEIGQKSVVDTKAFFHKIKLRSQIDVCRSNTANKMSNSTSSTAEVLQSASAPTEGMFDFVRQKGVSYCRIRPEFMPHSVDKKSGLQSSISVPQLTHWGNRFHLAEMANVFSNTSRTSTGNSAPFVGHVRKRIGRLGRLIFDRIRPTNNGQDNVIPIPNKRLRFQASSSGADILKLKRKAPDVESGSNRPVFTDPVLPYESSTIDSRLLNLLDATPNFPSPFIASCCRLFTAQCRNHHISPLPAAPVHPAEQSFPSCQPNTHQSDQVPLLGNCAGGGGGYDSPSHNCGSESGKLAFHRSNFSDSVCPLQLASVTNKVSEEEAIHLKLLESTSSGSSSCTSSTAAGSDSGMGSAPSTPPTTSLLISASKMFPSSASGTIHSSHSSFSSSSFTPSSLSFSSSSSSRRKSSVMHSNRSPPPPPPLPPQSASSTYIAFNRFLQRSHLSAASSASSTSTSSSQMPGKSSLLTSATSNNQPVVWFT